MSEDDPDWESFKTYKGSDSSDEPSRVPRWLGLVFHYFMIALCLAVTFCIGGFLFFFYAFDRSRAMEETAHDSWMRFIIGGVIGVVLVIYWRFRKMPPH